MSQSRKMLNGLSNAMEIINFYITDPRALRPHVDENQWDLPNMKVLEERFLHPERQHCHAFNSPFDHAPHRTLHAYRIVASRAEQDFIAMLDRYRFKHLNDFREEWIRDVGDD